MVQRPDPGLDEFLAPSSRSQVMRASCPVPGESTASSGVLSVHDAVPFKSAPRESRYSAIRR